MKIHLSCSDLEYFKSYAGSGKSYDKVWLQYSYADQLVELFKKHPQALSKPVKNILVLGAATGKILRVLERGLKAKSWGCEINPWAHAKIPALYRRRIKNSDMRDYVRQCIVKKKQFDVTFSNSLIYLPKKDLPEFLTNLLRVTRALHFNSSLKGYACPDPFRQTLETYEWWDRQFRKAGFQELKVPRTRRSYLWLRTS